MEESGLKYKLNYYLIVIIAFIIPLSKILVPPLVLLLFISSLMNNNLKIKNHPNRNKWNLLLFVPYALYALGIIYSENKDVALFNLEVKLALLAFPTSLILSAVNLKQILVPAMKAFIEGCLVAIVLCLIHAGLIYYYNRDIQEFYYSNLSYFHHASYFSMFLNFGLVGLYYYSFHPGKRFLIKTIPGFFLIILFSVFIALLASKTGIITLIFVHLYALFYWIFRHKYYLKGGLAILSIAIASIALYYSSSFLQNRIQETIFNTSANNTPTVSSTGARVYAWKASIDLIKEQPFFGYGPGDANDQLELKFKEQGLKKLASRNLNAHNQYLQTSIALGLVGGIALLLYLLGPFLLTFKAKEWIYSFFILITGFNFMTEAMLETQSGVIFYAFFNTLFFLLLIQSLQTRLSKQSIQA